MWYYEVGYDFGTLFKLYLHMVLNLSYLVIMPHLTLFILKVE